MGIKNDDRLSNVVKESAELLGVPVAGDVVLDAVDLVHEGLENIARFFKNRPITLKMFLEHTGDVADRIMDETLKKDHLPCYGGKLTLSMANAKAKDIRCVMKLYFQEPNGAWQLKEGEMLFPTIRFWDWEEAPEFERMRQGETVEFPIDPPGGANR